ncbi:hypothetical protein H2514_10800 [Lysobacter sp. CW239]|uniref:hypothetical protein n=1 Tax=Lysobacteraceae TaxID=32033 RepID=UPI0012EC5C6D|nr:MULTISPECIES: hypothetical protein [Lysobacter]QOD90668.1 hypothetical protein H2514_10800 [Lysobacter sp. CW239]
MAVILAFWTTAAAATPGQTSLVEPVTKLVQYASAPAAPAAPGRQRARADFKDESASAEAKHVAHWVVDSGDNNGLPYMIVDKVDARVFMFDAGGHLQGAAAALLGMSRGDGSAEGIGEQKLSAMRPEDRTTPAGRFVASLDRDLQGQEILWVDYDTALALHRVPKGLPAERRAQRLESPTPQDNRISYGCINVPVKFYEHVVSPAFTNTAGIVYILPEDATAAELFGLYEVDPGAHSRIPGQPDGQGAAAPIVDARGAEDG